jgi:hypothetical protein
MDEGFDFREWLKAMGYNKRDAARALARIIHEGGRRNGRAVGVAQPPEGT